MAPTRILAATGGALVATVAITLGSGLGSHPSGGPSVVGAATAEPASPQQPPPPQLPANFQGYGRYIVRDLGFDVPFVWQGNNGDSQMTAGGLFYPIWFTNIIYHGSLYTLTYKWPNIPLLSQPCHRVQGFNLQTLNDKLQTARFVGAEVLEGTPDRYVDHWRVGYVFGSTVPGEEFRLPFILGDIYVDQSDPTQWWQVLQYGVQNLYDPELDEWITMTTFSHKPGQVTFPLSCLFPKP
jgi:hypothetical protein